MKLTNIITISVIALWALSSCRGDGARLDGRIIGSTSGSVYLERVLPGAPPAIDTVQISSKGEFRFKVALPGGQPTIYNLRYLDDMIPLLLSPGERVKVTSLGDLGHGYRIDGSKESELVWELHNILTRGAASLDSISSLLVMSEANDFERNVYTKAYFDKHYQTKRKHIGFIVGHPSSLAAVYALYQRLPGDETLFGGENDHIYYQMVADSVRKRYPDSRYVAALDKEVAKMVAVLDMEKLLSEIDIAEINHPELELPDMYGQNVKLSSLAGKVVVLDFWTASTPEGRVNNAELRELWDAYSQQGLAIYQVSLDTSKPEWVNAVQEQKLPWITLCDFLGEASSAARRYNIGELPANYIIDREGRIAGKNLYGEALEAKIKELL